jgi:aminoglycoside phosphotransferase (APT) family kinase protein
LAGGSQTREDSASLERYDITAELVSALVRLQFPQWSELPISPVDPSGWDNRTFRLGTTLSVRLPSAALYVDQVDKEHEWLPRLREHLPLLIAEPLAKGAPALGFPHSWSIYRWIEGETAGVASVEALTTFASDVGGFLGALHRCDTSGGPRAGAHSQGRGGPVSIWDGQVRDAVARLGAEIDAPGALDVWDTAVASAWERAPVWVHGDITGSNLLVSQGVLAAVIDFGCCAIGDPACDTTIAWTFLDGDSRAVFRAQLHIDDATWARGRGWALWKALLELAADLSVPGSAEESAVRFGWRRSAGQIVDDVIADHRRFRADK